MLLAVRRVGDVVEVIYSINRCVLRPTGVASHLDLLLNVSVYKGTYVVVCVLV